MVVFGTIRIRPYIDYADLAYSRIIMTQVAVCTINDCGVLAIGRCASCTNAFCQSHQARYVGSRLPYASLCSSCLARSEANEKHRLDLIQADKDYIHGKAKDELRKGRI